LFPYCYLFFFFLLLHFNLLPFPLSFFSLLSSFLYSCVSFSLPSFIFLFNICLFIPLLGVSIAYHNFLSSCLYASICPYQHEQVSCMLQQLTLSPEYVLSKTKEASCLVLI
jgi:hypothetical protein